MRQPVGLIKHLSALGTQHTVDSSMRHYHWSFEISRDKLLADSRADVSRISTAVGAAQHDGTERFHVLGMGNVVNESQPSEPFAKK